MNENMKKLILDLGGVIPKDSVEIKPTNKKDRPLWCVYMHTSPSGKVYIGITSKKPEHRWGHKGNGYKDQIRIATAIRKYGWDNFKHEVLIAGLYENEALFLEEYLIKFYHSTDNKFGYNVLYGGKNPPKGGHPKKVICLNTLEIFDSVQEAERKYDICKGRISSVCKHKSSWAGYDYNGYNLRWEYYDPDKKYDKVRSEFLDPSKPVICLSTLEIFDSAREAGKIKVISPECITRCCKKKSLYAGKDKFGNGLVWEYYDPKKNDTYSYKMISKNTVLESNSRGILFASKKVICLNTLAVYNSIQEASKLFNAGTHISSVCAGKRKYAGVDPVTGQKLMWEYYDPNKRYTKVCGPLKWKRIMCVETGKIYNNAKIASEDTGFKEKSIRDSCYTKLPLYGFHFIVVE